MADIFHELPDADEYADYYEAIPEPECLDNICVSLSYLHLGSVLHSSYQPGDILPSADRGGRKRCSPQSTRPVAD